MDSRERRTPVKVETIRTEFLCSCFIERFSFLFQFEAQAHTKYPAAVSSLFH